MNKNDLIKKVAGQIGLSEKDTEKVIETTLEVITKSLQADEEVMLTGFGVFQARLRHARTGVNPLRPTEKIQIPEVRVPKFKAGKGLKDALKEKSESTPEPDTKPEEPKPAPEESAPAEPKPEPTESEEPKEESATE